MNVQLLLLVTLQTPGPAQSASTGFREWNYVCMPGAFQACASVSLLTQYDPTTQITSLRLQVANLQGSEAWLPNPGPYSIERVRINNMTAVRSSITQEPRPFPRSKVLNWHAEVGVRGPYEPFLPDELNGSSWGTAEPSVVASWVVNGGVWGCDGVLPGPRASYSTWMCRGYLEYVFTFAGLWEVTDASTLSLQFSSAGADQAHNCTTGIDCQMVTPEPITLVLLGTGVASLGGFHVRRRRRQQGAADA